MTSRDGVVWTKTNGLKIGVPTIGKIEPSTNLSPTSPRQFDVIIIGAGYSGLTAARDVTNAGLRVLLLEGRDRIGGRSWSSDIDGYPFEMGGTWVTWGQPHVWREISRYGMRHNIEASPATGFGSDSLTLLDSLGSRSYSHEKEFEIFTSGLHKFCNVDGVGGRLTIPYPHDESAVKNIAKFDNMSVKDRLTQIQSDLTQDEYTAVCSFVLLCSCGTPENTSFGEFLHWWALCNYNYNDCIEYLAKYKFKTGQSSFAINFWKEAMSTNNLTYAFNQKVTQIVDRGIVSVHVDDRVFEAAKVICTVPLNVLNEVQFDPPLSNEKQTAASIGHVNKCSKVHAEVSETDLRTWVGASYPDTKLVYAFGDGTTPAGKTHIVAFGADFNQLDPNEDVDKTIDALQALSPMSVERLVYHNWANDEFARGAWFFSSPGLVSNYLEDMRATHGNIKFANSDWAVGWRSFIDGAIEEGTRAAMSVVTEYRTAKSVVSL